eukprot:m.889692 g.889692  ORF g.889692 m.889692 type:complete len:356 (-) comp59947_c0_seq1:3927-4994(-)
MTELGDALARLLPVCAVRGCSNGTRSTPDNRHTERVLRPAAGKDMADTHVPLVGFGTFNSWQDAGKVAEAVVTAVEIGYRHIDCASFYDNEKEIGQSLKQLFERKLVQRSDLFLVSKLPQPCHARADVRPRLEQTLADLGVESVDLYLIHWPESWTLASWQGQVAYSGVGAETLINEAGQEVRFDRASVPIRETWEALEECVAAGLCKRIGVSNFSIAQIQDILTYCKVKPTAHELELHPYLTQADMLAFCHGNGIHVTAYSSLGRGWHKGDDQPELMQDPVIKRVASEVGKTVGQVLLRWATQQSISVIPKSLTPSRIAENFALDFTLSSDQMTAISALNKNHHFVDPFWHTWG